MLSVIAHARKGEQIDEHAERATASVAHITTPYISVYPWSAGFGTRRRSKMVTFYHGTSASRVESIFESGLIPPKCRMPCIDKCGCGYREDEHGNYNYEFRGLRNNFGFVFLAEEVSSALDWANASGWDCDDVVLAVEIPTVDVEPDPIVAGAWRTRGPIPPERISVWEEE